MRFLNLTTGHSPYGCKLSLSIKQNKDWLGSMGDHVCAVMFRCQLCWWRIADVATPILAVKRYIFYPFISLFTVEAHSYLCVPYCELKAHYGHFVGNYEVFHMVISLFPFAQLVGLSYSLYRGGSEQIIMKVILHEAPG